MTKDEGTKKVVAERSEKKNAERSGFAEVMSELYNATIGMTATALATRGLELAARYPDWSPAKVYNNLLYSYFKNDRIEDALAIMDVALRTAKENSHTYHNAAGIFVRAGKLDEAVECVRLAKAAGYPHMDKVKSDADLAPIADRKDFQELVGP